MASSRVGVRTSAWTSWSELSTDWIIGSLEGGGLAGPGLSLADHVAPLDQHRDRLLLDRARLLVADVLQGGEDLLGQAELSERHEEVTLGRRVEQQLAGGATALEILAPAWRRRAGTPRPRRRAGLARHAVEQVASGAASISRGRAKPCASQKPITALEWRSRVPAATRLGSRDAMP